MSDHLDGVLKDELEGCKQTAAARNALMVIVGHYRTRDHPIISRAIMTRTLIFIFPLLTFKPIALIVIPLCAVLLLYLHLWFDANCFIQFLYPEQVEVGSITEYYLE